MSDVAIHFTDESQATTLTMVPPEVENPDELIPLPGGLDSLPEFEKAKVAATEIKISGACAIDTRGDLSVALDDMIRAVGVYRVTKVNHFVNKAGDVVRQQVLTPVETLVIVPWSESDDGIIRARP